MKDFAEPYLLCLGTDPSPWVHQDDSQVIAYYAKACEWGNLRFDSDIVL